jgi:aspartyl-tRNA(Asn)/glutamyl-tRNA(Gln) amidotransferase subunit A
MNNPHPSSPVLQLAALLASGATDPIRLAEQTLAAIAIADPAIFTRVTKERALAEAKASAERFSSGQVRGLLDGIPIAWKDLFDLAGLITTAGSRALDRDPPAVADAPVVAALAAAGMVTVGRVNMTEFAYSGIGLNPHFGTPTNPHSATPRSPGGSSSGSAVAVARGLVAVAIGTDTGGSVRIPAAFNGIVGYKSSAGRYPMEGLFPLSRTLDTIGVFARAVLDAILADAGLRGKEPKLVEAASIEGLRIIVPTTLVLDGCEPAVIANFEASLAGLERAGVKIERRPFPIFDDIVSLNERYGPIVATEAYEVHRDRVAGPAAAIMDRRVVARLKDAASLDPSGASPMLKARRDLIARAVAVCGDAIVAYPTVAHVAPLIAPLEADYGAFSRANAKTLRNTALGNMLDWCGVSLPNGVDADGMPTGLLLSGMPGDDDRLLAIALTAEQNLGALDSRSRRKTSET